MKEDVDKRGEERGMWRWEGEGKIIETKKLIRKESEGRKKDIEGGQTGVRTGVIWEKLV